MSRPPNLQPHFREVATDAGGSVMLICCSACRIAVRTVKGGELVDVRRPYYCPEHAAFEPSLVQENDECSA